MSFRAKVGDFGLALPLKEDAKEARTARVVGTSGYIPPEYYRGVITTKMDTFGYGVVRVCAYVWRLGCGYSRLHLLAWKKSGQQTQTTH